MKIIMLDRFAKKRLRWLSLQEVFQLSGEMASNKNDMYDTKFLSKKTIVSLLEECTSYVLTNQGFYHEENILTLKPLAYSVICRCLWQFKLIKWLLVFKGLELLWLFWSPKNSVLLLCNQYIGNLCLLCRLKKRWLSTPLRCFLHSQMIPSFILFFKN